MRCMPVPRGDLPRGCLRFGINSHWRQSDSHLSHAINKYCINRWMTHDVRIQQLKSLYANSLPPGGADATPSFLEGPHSLKLYHSPTHGTLVNTRTGTGISSLCLCDVVDITLPGSNESCSRKRDAIRITRVGNSTREGCSSLDVRYGGHLALVESGRCKIISGSPHRLTYLSSGVCNNAWTMRV